MNEYIIFLRYHFALENTMPRNPNGNAARRSSS